MADIQIPQEARAFIEEIVATMDLGDATPDEREQLIYDLYLELDRMMVSRVIDALPDDSLDAYEQMMANNPDGATIQEFYRQQVPNLTQVLTAAAAEFKLMYMPEEGMQKL